MVITGFLIFWALAGPFGYWKLQRMKQHRATLIAQVADLSIKNSLLKKQIEAFQSDRKVQEEIVRKKLGWIKKDEILFKFISHRRNTTR